MSSKTFGPTGTQPLSFPRDSNHKRDGSLDLLDAQKLDLKYQSGIPWNDWGVPPCPISLAADQYEAYGGNRTNIVGRNSQNRLFTN
jgi:hypothetical protein